MNLLFHFLREFCILGDFIILQCTLVIIRTLIMVLSLLAMVQREDKIPNLYGMVKRYGWNPRALPLMNL